MDRAEGRTLYLAGIDDAHFYHLENCHRAAHDIPSDAVSILLSHTPEAYQHAAHAGFDLMLCGHTHGGQICLPGGIPLRTEADSPRRFARGPWRYHDMIGYTSAGAGTSIVDVRLNCPPEVTLHRLRRLKPMEPAQNEPGDGVLADADFMRTRESRTPSSMNASTATRTISPQVRFRLLFRTSNGRST